MDSPDKTVTPWIAFNERIADPDAEVWSYTFGERGPDFVLTIRGEDIGRIHLVTLPAGPAWQWGLHCSQRFGTVRKPHIQIGGEAKTKAEAIEAVRASWAIEREWRQTMRAITATQHGCWSPWMLEAAWRGYAAGG